MASTYKVWQSQRLKTLACDKRLIALEQTTRFTGGYDSAVFSFPVYGQFIILADMIFLPGRERYTVTLDQQDLVTCQFFDFVHGFIQPFTVDIHPDGFQLEIKRGGTVGRFGVVLDKAGGDDTGGDGHHHDAEDGDDNCHGPAQFGNGIDISITDGQQGAHAPPDAGEGIPEDFRLDIVFGAVHAQAGRQHQHQQDEQRRGQLVLFFIEDRSDDVEGIIRAVDAEQAQDTHHPQHPEHDKAGQEEERQDGQQVHDAVIGEQEPAFGLVPGQMRVKVFGGPDAQAVFNDEDAYGDCIQPVQNTGIRCHLIKCFQEDDRDVREDDKDNENIKGNTGKVFPVTDLNDIEYAFLQTFHCLYYIPLFCLFLPGCQHQHQNKGQQ